jgi:hypothetical protein
MHELVMFESGYFSVELTDNHQTAEVVDPFLAQEYFRSGEQAFVEFEVVGEAPGGLIRVPEFPQGIPGNDCGPSMVYDCAGTCVDLATALAWTGDGYCDDGTWGIDLTCSHFGFDDFDCLGLVPPHSMETGLCFWCCSGDWCYVCCYA